MEFEPTGAFPFKSADFEVCAIPDTIDNSPAEMSPFTRKNIDLHVMIKGQIQEVASSKDGFASTQSEVAHALEALGFYRRNPRAVHPRGVRADLWPVARFLRQCRPSSGRAPVPLSHRTMS
jgi:hypothetical protein